MACFLCLEILQFGHLVLAAVQLLLDVFALDGTVLRLELVDKAVAEIEGLVAFRGLIDVLELAAVERADRQDRAGYRAAGLALAADTRSHTARRPEDVLGDIETAFDQGIQHALAAAAVGLLHLCALFVGLLCSCLFFHNSLLLKKRAAPRSGPLHIIALER